MPTPRPMPMRTLRRRSKYMSSMVYDCLLLRKYVQRCRNISSSPFLRGQHEFASACLGGARQGRRPVVPQPSRMVGDPDIAFPLLVTSWFRVSGEQFSMLKLDNPAPRGDRNRVRAIVGAKLLHDVLHVGLHRLLGNA